MTIVPRRNFPALVLALLSIQLFFSTCKDKRAFNEETAQSTVDLRYAMGEMDEVLKDINTVIVEQYTLRTRLTREAGTSVCGVKLDTTEVLLGRMKLAYNGTDCFGRTKTGTVTFTVDGYPLQKWKHQNCVLTIDFTNYKVSRSTDGKFVKLQGRQTLRNESGNTWAELWSGASQFVTYLHSGEQMKITYTGDFTALMNVSRRLTYSYENGVTVCTVEGTGSGQGRSRVEASGQTTAGDNFAAEVTTPYVWKTKCGALAPLWGEVSVVNEGKEFDLKCRYGVDASGNAVKESAGCPFGWEVTWSRKKKTNSRLFGYY